MEKKQIIQINKSIYYIIFDNVVNFDETGFHNQLLSNGNYRLLYSIHKKETKHSKDSIRDHSETDILARTKYSQYSLHFLRFQAKV